MQWHVLGMPGRVAGFQLVPAEVFLPGRGVVAQLVPAAVFLLDRAAGFQLVPVAVSQTVLILGGVFLLLRVTKHPGRNSASRKLFEMPACNQTSSNLSQKCRAKKKNHSSWLH